MNDEPGAPTDLIRPLLRARQVREFTDTAVDHDALEAIADAARWSGSSQNRQPWRFIVIERTEMVRRVADAGLPHTRALSTAPAAIAIAMIQQQGSAVSHAFDEGRAAERMLIAASFLDLGAGIAWIGAEARPSVGELLGLPEDRFVRTVVAVGHPTRAARQPKSARGEARLEREETVFHERYGEA